MKYIRTNDGVFEIKISEELKKRGISNYFYIHNKDYNCNLSFEKSDLKNYKQADTIEELCDCFVVIRPHSRGTDHYTLHRFAFVKEHCLNGDEMVYGAIWTNKGLIYVAKMNDKGELELL